MLHYKIQNPIDSKLNNAIKLCNLAFCNRCFKENKHHHGGVYDYCFNRTVIMDKKDWLNEIWPENIVNISSMEFDENFINQISLNDQSGITQISLNKYDMMLCNLIFNGLFAENKTNLSDFNLSARLSFIVKNKNEIWIKHSPENDWIESKFDYPSYDDKKVIAVESGPLSMDSCLMHGCNKLYLMGLTTIEEIKHYSDFTRDIPKTWGRDHLYVKMNSNMPISKWIFAFRNQETATQSWLPLNRMTHYEPVL